jgi:hypothetical protein
MFYTCTLYDFTKHICLAFIYLRIESIVYSLIEDVRIVHFSILG